MTLQIVVGGQAGSEGKGAVAAYLSSLHRNSMVVRVGGSNAGHTVIGRCPSNCQNYLKTLLGQPEWNHPSDAHELNAHPWRLRQVPVAAVSNVSSTLVIAQGSEVDLEVVQQELFDLDSAGYDASHRLVIDGQATVVTAAHKKAEREAQLQESVGSTAKGIGAARAARAMRTAPLVEDLSDDVLFSCVSRTAHALHKHLAVGGDVLIEGTQGYLLGSHVGYYPQCTTNDTTAVDFLSQAGISPWSVPPSQLEIWVVFRTFPIRVAGNSGPLYGETSWAELGLEDELTTVTRKVRRVGQWHRRAVRDAMEANGWSSSVASQPVRTALTMADYLLPQIKGFTSMKQVEATEDPDQFHRMVAYHSKDLGRIIDLVGTGPSSIIDCRKD